VPISLEATFNELPEFLSESLVVKEMVNTKARARSFSRVSRTNSFLGGSYAVEGITS